MKAKYGSWVADIHSEQQISIWSSPTRADKSMSRDIRHTIPVRYREEESALAEVILHPLPQIP